MGHTYPPKFVFLAFTGPEISEKLNNGPEEVDRTPFDWEHS